MGLKKTKSIAGSSNTGQTRVLALMLCLQIFYAPASRAAQNPVSPPWSQQTWSERLKGVMSSAAKPKLTKPVEAPQEPAPIFGPGGLPVDTENFKVPSPSGLEKLGYTAPSQQEWESQQEELARAAGIKNARYAVPSWSTPRTGTGRFTTQELLRSRPYLQRNISLETQSGLNLSALSPQDLRDIKYPAAKLEKLKPEYEAMLKNKIARAKNELEVARLNYDQKLEGVKKAQRGVEYVQEQVAQFQKDKAAAHIAAREKAEQAVAQEQEHLTKTRGLLAEGEGVDLPISREGLKEIEKNALEQLDKAKKELARVQEIESRASTDTPEEFLQTELAAKMPEADRLGLEKQRAQARLAVAKKMEAQALQARSQAADDVEMAERELKRFTRAPLGVVPARVPDLPKEQEPVAAPTIALPVFNPKPGFFDFGEKAKSWIWGEDREKTEERAEKHLQKLTDLLRYTYTPKSGANPEVLAAIEQHINYMDTNNFSLPDSYRAQIKLAKQYEKHLQELRDLRSAQAAGQKPKTALPPFNPAQRRIDQSPQEYAQGYLLALLGQYHRAINQDEKLKAQNAIKEHAAYMKKEKFALAKNPQYAQEDKKLVKSFETWRDWLPSLPGRPQWTRMSYWWPGSTQPKPVAPKKINAPSTFAQLPVFKSQPGKTPEQNSQYYLEELLEHYRGSQALGIPPNPLAGSKIKAHINSMLDKGYAVDKSLLQELSLEE
jgi:hypothetical protein